MKPSDIAITLPTLIKTRRPVFIWGKSGIGKSALLNQIASTMKRQVNDMRLSQLDSIDLRGFPMPDAKKKSMGYLPSEDLPRENDPPGILFLDECNGAMPAVASAAYQLILDHRIGSYVLPKHWSIVAAGNNTGDRGITHQMPAPLNNRFVHIDYDLNADDWHNRAADDDIHPHIRAYLRLKPASLHVFDSTINPRSFPTPRSWYFADELYKAGYATGNMLELLKGTIGEGAAAEFMGFVASIADMPNIDSILMDPENAKLPATQAVMHAVVTTLESKTTVSNFARLMKYTKRLPREIQVVFVRAVIKKTPAIENTKEYMAWGLSNQDILM